MSYWGQYDGPHFLWSHRRHRDPDSLHIQFLRSDEMRSDELGATSPGQGTAQGTNHHDD
ncbi:hypothetical protein PCANC_27270 [Puccinia coronata f. sp. avenae]|uniref:Uncharacterized protein n=1 Tax=Puccinia coronata f. sp. avenae TaxID=200324 RepID=A0A2N5TNB3_9BASI|nr:hypothetical protein PCANC_27270 [Puccinia coronata f. sp. avenae]PLW26981.1 hypothetical protein PCASD_23026 [Puccinia coronata f. sp. avenae]